MVREQVGPETEREAQLAGTNTGASTALEETATAEPGAGNGTNNDEEVRGILLSVRRPSRSKKRQRRS